MQYMLFIIEPTGQRTERGLEKGKQVYDRMLGFTAELQQRGVLKATNSLQATRHGARVQVREGRQKVIDGPFAEAKEMIGGFFLLDVASKDEALAIAATCPAAEWATVEVRGVGPCYDD